MSVWDFVRTYGGCRPMVTALFVSTACGANAGVQGSPDGASTSDDASNTGTVDGDASSATAACGDLFDATFAAGCYFPVPPPAELARLRDRYIQLCEEYLALPGTRAVPADLEACAAANAGNKAGSCGVSYLSHDNLVELLPTAICSAPVGKLPNGSQCVDHAQCAGGWCSPAAVSCGVCTSGIPAGAPCDPTAAPGSTPCALGTGCASPSGGIWTCQPWSPPDAGPPVGDGGSCTYNPCEPPLICTGNAICAPLQGPGGPCLATSECAPGLVCLGSTVRSMTCRRPLPAGGSCTIDQECAQGLVCEGNPQGCVGSRWAASGQPCGGEVLCLGGPLPGTCPSFESLDGSTPVGTCPQVLADGQPCDPRGPAVCDTFASCVNGACAISLACQ